MAFAPQRRLPVKGPVLLEYRENTQGAVGVDFWSLQRIAGRRGDKDHQTQLGVKGSRLRHEIPIIGVQHCGNQNL
jgi:hypothetical protein